MRTAISFALGAAVGAAAAYLLDPDAGARRRHQTRDKAASKASRAVSTAQSEAKYAAGKVQGAAATVVPTGGGLKDADDVTLARKVETEIFRDADAPKGGVSVDVQAGVAYLRGEVPTQEWIDRFGDGARSVSGVKGVKNLLHLPGAPAPAGEPRGAVTDRTS